MKGNWFLATVLGMSLSVSAALPEASAKQLPRWRGFNLLEKFMFWGQNPQPRFKEEDFKMIHELGFNFVRLPMDYRFWIIDGDWEKINYDVLKDVDEAIEFGKKYDIHVCVNFHRAPGYTVANPKEKKNLWKDEDAQRVCAMHWGVFAKRYKGIPNSQLSFNLFNEPAGIDGETYAKIVKIMADAIHKEDPDRLIICDGLNWGSNPCKELIPLGVAQATRGYRPSNISHYKASWANGDQYALPTWPLMNAVGWLAGPSKPEMDHTMPITWNCPETAKMRIKIGVVSTRITLTLKADGQQIWEREFTPGPGEGEWEKSVYAKEWNIYQNVYNLNCFIDIPAGAKQLELTATKGDWVTIPEIGVTVGDKPEVRLTLITNYGQKQNPITFADGKWSMAKEASLGRQWLWKEGVAPWIKLREQGSGIIVGEFGAYNRTPHDVVLAWLEDCLINWKEANMGWAMWNFRGSFGVLDSDRKDVQYEDFNGHKLDRKMLDLLQKY